MCEIVFTPDRRYFLGIVGKKVKGEDHGEIFKHGGEEFHLVFDCKIKLLIRDVNSLDEFRLELVAPKNKYLALYFYPEARNTLQTNSQWRSRRNIFRAFFSFPGGSSKVPSQPTITEDTEAPGEYELLYERLRAQHRDAPWLIQGLGVQHNSLRPVLRKYQEDAVRFMIYRETILDTIPAAFDRVIGNAVEDQEFFLNAYTGHISDVKPRDIPLPSGGILADEMGLGKTVEILALILNNKPDMVRNTMEKEAITGITSISARLKCLCTKVGLKGLIKCIRCEFYQHVKCVHKNRTATSIETENNYICPQCWSKEDLVETGATIIVTPYSIKRQWEKEIKKHVDDPSFKVIIYDGVSRLGWISPLDLAQYDVVITDYNVFKSEIHFLSDSKEGSLRHEKKHLNPTSPLVLLKWWRVCLDEAQMVEGPKNQSARMVKTLSTVHRWAVTGTPIEKSINNLYGLLVFLDCIPYEVFQVWARLAEPYLRNGDPDPLIQGVLRKIMWRTCKRHVVDQIGVPPQTQRCHKIAMSDLQMVFYRDQHEQCRRAFVEKADKMERYLAASMSKWDTHSIKTLLEPLRKLRQDCTVPSVISKGGDQISKRLLSPDELYSHLLTNNELECKTELRTIVSSLNGLAGTAILEKDHTLAARYYKSALLRAEENKTGPITVDSLLRIHALHNLIRINTTHGVETASLEEYKLGLRMLETKYTDNYYQLMKAAENQLNSIKLPVKINCHQDLGLWWRGLFKSINQGGASDVQQLLQKINFEIRMNHFADYIHDDFKTTDGIDYVLTTWWDVVIGYRKRVHRSLEKLKFFTEKIKPGYIQTAEEGARIQSFIVSASECHLIRETEEDKEKEGDEEYEPEAKLLRKSICELCQAKLRLIEYECKIFDKSFNLERQEGDGTWKPSLQEWILRVLQQILKKEMIVYPGQMEDSEYLIQMMEKLKTEYKELSKYWVEINYTASAYDELNMCKLQLNAVDPEILKKGEKMKRNDISIHEIELTREQFQAELNEAELAFSKSQRNLSYLKHLSSNPEVQTCPICSQKPEDKYSVWECGHQMCIQCLLKMKKYHGLNLNCPVCRHNQKFNDINFVTLEKHNIHVEGKYSAKIIRVVQEVQALRKDDNDVKIIIFSQWDGNLSVIQSALNENKISCRTKSHRPEKMIEEFKSPTAGVTCLLLPLAWGSKGLNLIEATHIFLIEPILNPSEELQAVGRVHRIGQTRPTFVHRFIVEATIEETIYNTVSSDNSGKWRCKNISLDNLRELFKLGDELRFSNEMNNPYFGWELLNRLIEEDVKNSQDIIVALVHWQLVQLTFSCLGAGDEKIIKDSDCEMSFPIVRTCTRRNWSN